MLVISLLLLIIIPMAFGIDRSSSLSIEEFISNVMLEQDEIRVLLKSKREKSCIISVLELYSPRCELNDLFDKRIPALELTKCIFGSSEMPPLPAECMCVPPNMDKCVAVLAKDGVLWTTYFGYLNFMDTLCSYYHSDLASIRLWEDYNLIMRRLCEAVESFDYVRTTQMEALQFKIDELANVVDNMLHSIHEEIRSQKRNSQKQKATLQQDVTEMKAWINQEQLKIVQLLSLRMEKLGNEVESAHLNSIGLVEQRMEDIIKLRSVHTLSTLGLVFSAVVTLLLALLRFNFYIVVGATLGVYYGFAVDVTSVLDHFVAA